jgi:hypothetical protein
LTWKSGRKGSISSSVFEQKDLKNWHCTPAGRGELLEKTRVNLPTFWKLTVDILVSRGFETKTTPVLYCLLEIYHCRTVKPTEFKARNSYFLAQDVWRWHEYMKAAYQLPKTERFLVSKQFSLLLCFLHWRFTAKDTGIEPHVATLLMER